MKKKKVIILASSVLIAAIIGGAAFFFLQKKEADSHPIDEHNVQWKSALPITRHFKRTSTESSYGSVVSYGEYFIAITAYLSQNHFKSITQTVKKLYQLDITSDDITSVKVFLIKHGEFYHPSRIQMDIGNRHLCFVLNVADFPFSCSSPSNISSALGW